MKHRQRHMAGLALLAVAPLAAWAAPRVIVIEAETAAAIEAPLARVCATNLPAGTTFIAGASGGSYLEIPEKAGNPPDVEAGLARCEIEVPADGDYTLWARVYWEGECSNSFTVRIDDGAPFLFGENATYRAWHWIKYPVSRMTAPLRLKKGKHTVLFSNREDGVRLDQVILSAEKRFVPVGIETPTTTGGGNQ